MRRPAVLVLLAVLAASVPASDAAAQGAPQCYGFGAGRDANIREGLCVGSQRNLVFGTTDQVRQACESLIVCGGQGDLGDCHLARNVCKGFAAARCDASGFDVFNGPAIQNAACRARLNACGDGPEGDRALCSQIRALIPPPPTPVAVPVIAPPSKAAPALPPVRFRLPVEDARLVDVGDSAPWNLSKGPVHVDHDPATRNGGRGLSCLDYRGRGGLIGLPWCYGGHRGTDFMLRGGFPQMDRGGNFVVAAADGEVVEVRDDLYDRCHGELITSDGRVGNIDCDGRIPRDGNGGFDGNRIRIRHRDQLETTYFHIQRGSALVRVGQQVTCGMRIAGIGSSGISFGPHVHFEVSRNGQVVDPFGGPLSQPESLWVAQGVAGNDIPAARCQ